MVSVLYQVWAHTVSHLYHMPHVAISLQISLYDALPPAIGLVLNKFTFIPFISKPIFSDIKFSGNFFLSVLCRHQVSQI